MIRITMLSQNKIIDYLKKQDLYEIDKIETDRIAIRKGSALVTLRSKNFLKKEWLEFNSTVVKGAEIDEKLMSTLLTINQKLPIGAFGISKDNIVFRHAILGGRHLNFDDFTAALMVVATISDKYDDIIAKQYGGTTALADIF